MPLKLVARLPYWSSASTSKPNVVPAVRLAGGSVTKINFEAAPAVTLMLLVVTS